MGKKAKSSRKGKKAWRANISTEDIDEFFEKSTKDALSGAGGSLVSFPDNSLFFVDKSKDLSLKPKIEKHRGKVLHCESILQKNPFVQVIQSSLQKQSKKKPKNLPKVKEATRDDFKERGVSDSRMVDLWEYEGEIEVKAKKKFKPSIIPAVEVEPPGCSYNPSFESHQDSLAHAVADEMQKVYKAELGPEPVPLIVTGEPINEEDMYFLDADSGSDDANEEITDGNENVIVEKRSAGRKRVTRVELNKRARRKEHLRKKAEEKKVEGFSKEIDNLPDIIQEIAKEDEEKHKKHIRRVVAKQERQKLLPPRLGKHKFEPATVQVLLSEEISGSLRKLKGCCTLAKDRFKSLEKRGLVVPTSKSGRK